MAIVQAPPAASVQTPPPRSTRDTGIDLVRALCVAGVVLLHSIMVGVTVTQDGAVFDNASVGTWWIVPLSWLFQVMPLFFVIGGFSGRLAYRRARQNGGDPANFVAARIHRLLRPAVVAIAIVGAALLVLSVLGVPAEYTAVAGFRYSQPLWFLGVFLLCQVLLPALVAAHERAPMRAFGLLLAAAIGVDVLRAVSGVDALGFLNLAFVWLVLQQIGFFLADGRIDALSRRTRIVAGLGAVVLLLITFATGIYSPDLIENINPPTTALLLVGIAHTSALSLHRQRLERASRHPGLAAFTQFVTLRTMTIYLWHMPVLLTMAGVTAAFAVLSGTDLAAVDSLGWWVERPQWLATALLLTALIALPLARIEMRPAPALPQSSRRVALGALIGLIAVVLLLAAGTTVLTAAVAVALILLALRLATRERTQAISFSAA